MDDRLVDHQRRQTKSYERLIEAREMLLYLAMSRILLRPLTRKEKQLRAILRKHDLRPLLTGASSLVQCKAIVTVPMRSVRSSRQMPGTSRDCVAPSDFLAPF